MSYQKRAAYANALENIGGLIGNYMTQSALAEERDQRELAREERADKRLMEREQRADDRKEAGLLKQAEIMSQAEQNAPAVGDERRYQQFKKDLGETALTEDESRKVFDEQYNQRKVTNEAGGDRYVERYSKQKEDVLNEVRRLGGNSDSIKQATEVWKGTLAAENEADKRNLDERKYEAAEKQRRHDREVDWARVQNQEKTANAAMTRANNAGGSGGGGDKDDGLKRLKALYDMAQKEKPEPPRVATKAAVAAHQKSMTDWQEKYGADVSAYEAALRGSSGTSKPAVTTETKPAQAAVEPPKGAIEALKKNPNLKDQFDSKYGKGASALYIGKK